MNQSFIKKTKGIALLLSLCAVSGSCFAATTYTQFGRYLSVTNSPNKTDPYGITGVVTRDFPKSIKTVGQAVKYTLSDTGYSLLPKSESSASAQGLYQKTLPLYLRNIGPVPLNKGLSMLCGRSFQLVVDPVHRLVTFKLRHDFQSL